MKKWARTAKEDDQSNLIENGKRKERMDQDVERVYDKVCWIYRKLFIQSYFWIEF